MNRTKHLMLTEDGLVWLYSLRSSAILLDGQSCKFIGCPEWPVGLLGEEPDWFWPEIEELRALWNEDQRILSQEAASEMARATWDYWENCITK